MPHSAARPLARPGGTALRHLQAPGYKRREEAALTLAAPARRHAGRPENTAATAARVFRPPAYAADAKLRTRQLLGARGADDASAEYQVAGGSHQRARI